MMVYIFCASICIINSYIVIKRWGERKKRCTLRVPVKVIEVIAMKPRRSTVLVYKPIFEVDIMDNKVLINSAIYTPLFKLEAGQGLQLCINPDNPQDFMYDSPYKDKLLFLDILPCVIPLVFMFLWFLFSE